MTWLLESTARHLPDLSFLIVKIDCPLWSRFSVHRWVLSVLEHLPTTRGALFLVLPPIDRHTLPAHTRSSRVWA